MRSAKSRPSSSPLRLLAFAGFAVLIATGGGCQKKETKYDVFLRGLQLEGEAERGPCKLMWDAEAQHHVINAAQINACLEAQVAALEVYEEAKAMGYAGPDFERVHARALERQARLKQMLDWVGDREQEKLIEKGKQL